MPQRPSFISLQHKIRRRHFGALTLEHRVFYTHFGRVRHLVCGIIVLLCVMQGRSYAAQHSQARPLCPLMPEIQNMVELQELVQKKVPAAYYCLADSYDANNKEPYYAQMAAQWMRTAAESGYIPAMARFGEMLFHGRGVQEAKGKAVEWFRKAAEHGNSHSQAYLGQLYEHGIVVEQDQREAAAWYARAALYKQASALVSLGKMYMEGRGVSQDRAQGTLLLSTAALQGDQEAINALRQWARTPTPEQGAFLGLQIAMIKRDSLRKHMQKKTISPLRDDARYFCDMYNLEAILPYMHSVAACFTPTKDAKLALLKIAYITKGKAQAEEILLQCRQNFGAADAQEQNTRMIWNFDTFFVIAQYLPHTNETSVMYVLHEEYAHLTDSVQ